jgi:hypothetical protein
MGNREIDKVLSRAGHSLLQRGKNRGLPPDLSPTDHRFDQ